MNEELLHRILSEQIKTNELLQSIVSSLEKKEVTFTINQPIASPSKLKKYLQEKQLKDVDNIENAERFIELLKEAKTLANELALIQLIPVYESASDYLEKANKILGF